MRIAYFDCFSGVSGDMTIGALLDNGVKIEYLRREVAKLGLNGYRLAESGVRKNGLAGVKFDVHVASHIRHEKRNMKDIRNIILKSRLSERVKNHAINIFENICHAEAKAHGVQESRVIFHEVGDMDSIIDIAGTCIALEKLNIDRVCASALPWGRGWIKSESGVYPNPAPATANLLKGLPVFFTESEHELVTPTGAGIIRTLCSDFVMPRLKIESVGYGAGTLDLKEHPNLLRVVIGEKLSHAETDTVTVIEVNLDDMPGEDCGYLLERLLEEGALDAYWTPVQMKKSRPGALLTVLAQDRDAEKFTDLIMEESTTFGLRFYQAQRKKLERKITVVGTKWGKVRVKIGWLEGRLTRISPEYEDCKTAALKFKVPLNEVYQAVRAEAKKIFKNET